LTSTFAGNIAGAGGQVGGGGNGGGIDDTAALTIPNSTLSSNAAGAGGGSGSGKEPLLGQLAANGGPTQTQALLAGSPAIDAGGTTGFPATDQRGDPRPDGTSDGGACDIGAYESQGVG
jgi:hypothetical protein